VWRAERLGYKQRTPWDRAPVRDRSAGDSSPVTTESGRFRGRPDRPHRVSGGGTEPVRPTAHGTGARRRAPAPRTAPYRDAVPGKAVTQVTGVT